MEPMMPRMRVGTVTGEDGNLHGVCIEATLPKKQDYNVWTIKFLRGNKAVLQKEITFDDKFKFDERFLGEENVYRRIYAVAKDCDAVWKAFLASVCIRDFPQAADMLEGRAQAKSETAQQQTQRRSGDDPTDEELMNIFRAEYIHIPGNPFKVWHAYNYDTHNFDMQRKSMCVAV
jgi:hypothetical protein